MKKPWLAALLNVIPLVVGFLPQVAWFLHFCFLHFGLSP